MEARNPRDKSPLERPPPLLQTSPTIPTSALAPPPPRLEHLLSEGNSFSVLGLSEVSLPQDCQRLVPPMGVDGGQILAFSWPCLLLFSEDGGGGMVGKGVPLSSLAESLAFVSLIC